MRPISFAVPAEVAFDYLADPRNRPEWQSSLRSVVVADDGPVRPGMEWVDVTAVGVRPQMQTVSMTRPHRWVERGTWRGFTATLTLSFQAATPGCEVQADFAVGASGALRPLARVLTAGAAPAVSADLRRAARILSGRAGTQ